MSIKLYTPEGKAVVWDLLLITGGSPADCMEPLC